MSDDTDEGNHAYDKTKLAEAKNDDRKPMQDQEDNDYGKGMMV